MHATYQPPKWTNSDEIVHRIQNYPRAALYRGEQAIVWMRVIVEADGTISGCYVENSTETEKLASPACKEMENAVFEPALDVAGVPMRSFYATTIKYVIG